VAAPGAAGRFERVRAAPPTEVFVAAGPFAWGLEEKDVLALDAECRLAYGEGTLCAVYQGMLLGMERRVVYLDAFAIDRLETTVAEYRRCVAAGRCAIDPLVAGDQRHLAPELPMVNLTWDEARSYCAWVGKRLPREAEWERAARGFEGRIWPWGDVERPNDWNHGRVQDEALRALEQVRNRQRPVLPPQLPDDSDGHASAAPPGSYLWGEGPHRTLDQAGNVAEWTEDALGEGYRDLSVINPTRPPTPDHIFVVRGGSWAQPPFAGRAAARDPRNLELTRDRRFSWVGVRCARSLR